MKPGELSVRRLEGFESVPDGMSEDTVGKADYSEAWLELGSCGERTTLPFFKVT